MHYYRNLSKSLIHYLKKYPIITITGPRQSGKTTLAQKTCPNYEYITLEDLDNREFATSDPRGFLKKYANNVIIDEAQNAPDLFSYLQGNVDKDPTPGRFILTGSEQFSLNAKISQTLAGRIARLTLLPLSMAELEQRDFQKLWHNNSVQEFPPPSQDLFYYLYNGLYPRLYKYNLDPKQFFRDYINTYVTKDLQELIHVSDIKIFHNFLKMLANRAGQIVNLSSLGNDIGISHTTIKRWLFVLESCYIIFLLRPFYKNFNKRIIKSPKIYFLDTGLLCYLLRITSAENLQFHSQIGGIFESFVVSELIKSYYHHDLEPTIYFWQDFSSHEIDLIVEKGEKTLPIEIKSSQTISSKFFTNINYFLKLNQNQKEGFLIYGGDEWQKRHNFQILPWYGIS